jgi:hypothetical protein
VPTARVRRPWVTSARSEKDSRLKITAPAGSATRRRRRVAGSSGRDGPTHLRPRRQRHRDQARGESAALVDAIVPAAEVVEPTVRKAEEPLTRVPACSIPPPRQSRAERHRRHRAGLQDAPIRDHLCTPRTRGSQRSGRALRANGGRGAAVHDQPAATGVAGTESNTDIVNLPERHGRHSRPHQPRADSPAFPGARGRYSPREHPDTSWVTVRRPLLDVSLFRPNSSRRGRARTSRVSASMISRSNCG